jgi:hypothetical protein
VGALLVAFLMALGAGTWVFTKLQNRNGYGNSKNALIGAAIVSVLVLFVIYSLARMFIHD